MTTWIELGTQALQGLFQALGTGAGPEPADRSTPNAAELAVATAQNLWLRGLKLALQPVDRALALGSDRLGELGQSYWQAVATATGSLAEMPLLGPGREWGQALLAVWDAWVQTYPASAAYQGVLLEIQRRSLMAFLDELIALTGRGQPLTDAAQVQRLWGQVADRVFADTLATPDALRTRGRFLNAVNRYRLGQQTLTEMSLTALNLPTRSEVDDIHQTLYHLRREVKRLKRALAETAPKPP